MEKVLSDFDKQFSLMQANERFNKKVNKIINSTFRDADLIQATRYEKIIVSYLKTNIKAEYLKDDTKLSAIINVYFQILTNRDVSIDKYIFLQSCSRTVDNEIAREIEKNYLDSKFILMSASDLFEIKVEDNSDSDKVIDEILMKYEDHNIRGRIYGNLFQRYKNDQEKAMAVTKALIRLDHAYNVLVMIKASNSYVPTKEEHKVR